MNLVTAICNHDVKILLNLEELKNSDNLKNAKIFNMLFGFDTEILKKTIKKDKNGYVTIFRDFNINSREVLDFLYFVRYGKIKYENNIEYIKNKQENISNYLLKK